MEFTWTSIADWLVRAGLGGSLLIVSTLLAMRWVRQPARRQRLGELGLAAALVLAALCWGPAWLPLWQPTAPSPASTMEMVFAPMALPDDDDALNQFAAVQDIALVQPPPEAAPESASFHLADWILPAVVIAYGAGAMFYLARWLTGVVVLWRIVRAAQPAAPELLADLHARWHGGVARPESSKGVTPLAATKPFEDSGRVTRRKPRLLISKQLQVPASCGVFRPTLILPAALATADHDAEREWVFDHELTHLVRRDAWSAVLFALGQMLYFALPWFWWLKRIVRLCQEYVADAAACRRRPADEYAEFLLSLTTAPAAPLAATGVTGTSSDLYRRVAMLLQNPVRVELTCPRFWTVGAAGVLLGLAVIAAGVGPAQAQPPNQKEVLEQLERIQDMVNKLRHQLADQPKDVLKTKTKPHVIVLDVDVEPNKDNQPARDAKSKADEAVRKAFLYLQKAQTKEAGQQEAQAKMNQARAELHLKLVQIENEAAAAGKSADKKLKQLTQEQALVEQQRALAHQQYAQAVRAAAQAQPQRKAEDQQLKHVLEVLQKHLAELKDRDPAARQAVEDAIKKLQDVMKRAPAAQSGSWIIRTPAAPAVPAPPGLPKAGVIVGAPEGVYQGDILLITPQTAAAGIAVGKVVRLRTTLAQPSTGRLGIRVDAPGAILADQLNLPKDQGLVIAEVYDNSVAKKVGIKANDILLKINQQPVSNDPQKLIKQVADLKADMPFDIVVLRRGKQETIQNVRLPEPTPRATAVRALTGWRDLATDSKNVRVTITAKHTGNTLTLHRNEGGAGITVTAEIADGKPKVTAIAIVEKDNTSKYANVNEVPEPNRAKVQHLLQLLDSVSLPSRNPHNAPNKTPSEARPEDGEIDFFYSIPQSTDPTGRTITKPAPKANVDLYYQTPQNATPAPTGKTFDLQFNERNFNLPIEVAPPGNRKPLALPGVNVQAATPTEARSALPALAAPTASPIRP